MPLPLRIILHAAEGDFMLDREFADGQVALDFARMVGFKNFEITNDYCAGHWKHLDPTIQPPRMSFMYNTHDRHIRPVEQTLEKKEIEICQ